MKVQFFILSFLWGISFASAQQYYLDSLLHKLNTAKNDTERVLILSSLSLYESTIQPVTGISYAYETIRLSQKSNYLKGEFLGFWNLAVGLELGGNYPKALEMALASLKLAERLKTGKNAMIAKAYFEIGSLNRAMGDYRNAIINLHRAINLFRESGESEENLIMPFTQLGYTYIALNQSDSSMVYGEKGYDAALHFNKRLAAYPLSLLGILHDQLGHNELAEKFYKLTIQNCEQFNILFLKPLLYNYLSYHFGKANNRDSCVYYAQKSLRLSQSLHYGVFAFQASSLLAEFYKSENKPDSTLKYMNIMLATKDSMFSQEKMQQYQLLAFDEEQRQVEKKVAITAFRNQIKIYALLAALAVFLLLVFILFRNARQKQRTNAILKRQKEEIQNALTDLKSAQTQLVQREKMASLGELTAGIAHEIQNPLNFVNNFSEVNVELINEMKKELEAGNNKEAVIIASDIEQNLEKITHHGKRADSIVKGMLYHSRSSSDQREPTDINVLADEYLRLSYHGLRAKKKSFTATIQTDLEQGLEQINIIPQDIGRVILNLFTNAFYSITAKKKFKDEASLPDGQSYEPTVSVSTKKVILSQGRQGIQIIVRDNGMGIPKKIIDKIFQPFFTTKPSGEGTGLGLSMSYDIITKGHGGEMKVETKEGEFAAFFVFLPY